MIRAATDEEIEEYAGRMGYVPSRASRGILFLPEESGSCDSACVLFDHWSFSAVQVHVYASSMKALFDETYLREIFYFPFITAGRRVLIAVTPGDARGSLAVSDWLGFRETYRIDDGWKENIPMIVKELRREHCRFLPAELRSLSRENLGATPIGFAESFV